MTIFGTQMHIVTFVITAMEVMMLFYTCIYYLQRPTDERRKWFLILLILLICYNLAGSLFPDEQFIIPVTAQYVISYGTGVIMSIFFAYYIYQVFQLRELSFIAKQGAIYFIAIPYVALFAIPYAITGNFTLFNKLVVIVPFFYGIAFSYFVTRAFSNKYRSTTSSTDSRYFKESLFTLYAAFILWMSMPVVTYFEGSQVLEHSLTNAGFLVMTFSYIRTTIYESKKEYVEHQATLERQNQELQSIVSERTMELKKALDQKSNFLIKLSHEFKTPTTVLVNYIDEFIEKYGDSPEGAIIKNNIKKLNRDVINFLDIEKFDRGSNIYDHNFVSNFSKDLRTSVKLFEPHASKNGIRIDHEIDEDVFTEIDPRALQRIINNLMDNAIKFSKRDTTISVSLKATKYSTTFSVEDQGIGILEREQKNIFKPNFQIASKRSNSQGMGMGLSIVSNILNEIDAQIHIKSEYDVGTRFDVVFKPYNHTKIYEPYDVDESLDIISPPNDLVTDFLGNANAPYLLIIEDDLALLRMLKDRLTKMYNVYIAENGVKALVKIKGGIKVDLVVTDIMMDGLDGIEYYKEMNELPQYSHVPVLYKTEKNDSRSKAQGLDMGAIDYIEKPFKVELLQLKIKSILDQNRSQRNAIMDSLWQVVQGNGNGKVNGFNDRPNLVADRAKQFNLSRREVDVCELLIKGKTHEDIADQLNISPHTVHNHVSRIYSKCGVNSKISLKSVLEDS